MENLEKKWKYEEMKEQAIAAYKELTKKVEKYLLRPVRKDNTWQSSFLDHIILTSGEVTKRDKLFYYLCEAVQVRYSDRELEKYLNPKEIKEKQILRRELLDFIHMLETSPKTQTPVWRHAFECMENTKNDNDVWLLDGQKKHLIKIPAGSTTARCLSLKELDFLPKEEGL